MKEGSHGKNVMYEYDQRMHSGSSRLIVHALLVHARERERVIGSRDRYNHTVYAHVPLSPNAVLWTPLAMAEFAKEGKTRVRMNDSDEGMRSDSSNSSCMHDCFKPQ
jgi:hypothetical protein